MLEVRRDDSQTIAPRYVGSLECMRHEHRIVTTVATLAWDLRLPDCSSWINDSRHSTAGPCVIRLPHVAIGPNWRDSAAAKDTGGKWLIDDPHPPEGKRGNDLDRAVCSRCFLGPSQDLEAERCTNADTAIY